MKVKKKAKQPAKKHDPRWAKLKAKLKEAIETSERMIDKHIAACADRMAPFPYSHFEHNAIEVITHRGYLTAERCLLDDMIELEKEFPL